jgi:acetyltransferase-like isoleucine patch superfamily enzyme
MSLSEVTTAAVKNVVFGNGVKIVQPCNLYDCKVGSHCFIGPFVEIQKGATIGKYCKIQSHSFICEMTSLADHCFVGHGVMFINDDFKTGAPAKGDRTLWKATEIGNHVSIGSNSTILPVKICDGCVIGAGSVVTKNLTQKGIYAGNPARLIRELQKK